MQRMVKKGEQVMMRIFHLDSKGFTFLESAVSLSIISVLFIAISSVQISVMKTFVSESSKIRKAHNIYLIERRLKNICDEIRIPFWIGEPKVFSNGNIIQFEYYKGLKTLTDFIFPDYVVFNSSDFAVNKERRMLKIEYTIDGEYMIYEKFF